LKVIGTERARKARKARKAVKILDSGRWTLEKSRAGKAKGKYKARAVGGEVAEDLFNRGLCLPSGTAMTESDLDRVISTITKCRR
jgi:dTDP-4-amino-4,6-dideoxygalactose transaminase